MVVVAFIVFVYWNGSIVLGNIHFLVFPGDDLFGSLRGPKDPLSHTYPTDTAGAKEAHAVTPHFSQMLYFSLVSVLAQAPMQITITQAVDLFRMFRKSRPLLFFQMFLALVVGMLSVHFFRLCQTQMT